MPSKPRYSSFVEHPRYGRGPRFTTLVPKGDVYFGWHTEGRIPKTAVKADIENETESGFGHKIKRELFRTSRLLLWARRGRCV
jgi:hypothetical protein